MYFRTREAVAIVTVSKETQAEAVTGVLLHLWLILREVRAAKSPQVAVNLLEMIQFYCVARAVTASVTCRCCNHTATSLAAH